MKIGYVAGYDATDISNWSGLGYNIWRAIERQGHEIRHFQPSGLGARVSVLMGLANRIIGKVSGKRYLRRHSVLLAKYQSRQVDGWMAQNRDLDAIVSPGSIPVAFIRSRKPLITWADATHTVLFNSYPEFHDICQLSHWEGDKIEKAYLSRCAAAIFSSDWAAKSAIEDYGAQPSQVHVVPFGANLTEIPDEDEILGIIKKRSASPLQILFVGVDWNRKGGGVALDAARFLRNRGLDVTLRVMGCEVPASVKSLPWVLCDGFVDKRIPEGRRQLDVAFRKASLLMVPSVAECYGLVYCEANAYGLPAIGCDVGGVSTIIRDGANGFLMEPGNFSGKDGERLFALLKDPTAYTAMSLNARRAFGERLNWDVAGNCASRIILECVEKTGVA